MWSAAISLTDCSKAQIQDILVVEVFSEEETLDRAVRHSRLLDMLSGVPLQTEWPH